MDQWFTPDTWFCKISTSAGFFCRTLSNSKAMCEFFCCVWERFPDMVILEILILGSCCPFSVRNRMVKCIFSCFQCVWIENQGFQLHQGYRCNCKQGYEYPWKEANEYFYTGDLIEDSRLRYVANRTNRYERLKCRMSSATHANGLLSTVVLSLLMALWLKWFVPDLNCLWKDYFYAFLPW